MKTFNKYALFGLLASMTLSSSAQDANYWGYTNEKDCNRSVGIKFNTAEKQGFAIKISKEKAALLKGRKITGLRALFCTTQATNVKAFVTTQLGVANDYEADVKIGSPRFTDFKFPASYTIAGDKELYVGFTLNFTGNGASVLSYDQSAELPEGIAWGYTGDKWENVKYGGAPAILLLLDDMPAYTDVLLKPISFENFYTAGNEYSFSGQINNPGTETIHSFDLAVRVGDGEETVEHVDNISLAPNTNYDFTIKDCAITSSGNLPFYITVKNVNGKEDADVTDNEVNEEQYIYPENVKKRILLEVFTGMGCSNCPAGHSLIESVIAGREDVVVVEHHTFYSGDALSMKESMEYLWYFNSPNTYAPGLMGNRLLYNQAASSPVVEAVSESNITQVVNAASTSEPYVSVEMETKYDEATRKLEVTVYVTTYVMPENTNNSINIFITQSGISGDDYYQAGASSSYIHNHAMRGALTGTYGEDIELKLGETVKHTFSYTLPDAIVSTASTPENFFVPVDSNKMEVVAFVLGKTNSALTNQVYNVVALPLTGGSTVGLEGNPEIGTPLQIYVNDRTISFCEQVSSAEVYHISGKLVASGKEAVTLPAGFYIVRAMDAQGSRVIKKIQIR